MSVSAGRSRVRLAGNLIVTGGKAVERGLMAHCLTTTQMAERLGLGGSVCDPLQQVFTRWDARGVPDGIGGEEIAPLTRLFHLADIVEVHHRDGLGAAMLVDTFCAAAGDVRGVRFHRRLIGAIMPAGARASAADPMRCSVSPCGPLRLDTTVTGPWRAWIRAAREERRCCAIARSYR
jgi:hypothetical protein